MLIFETEPFILSPYFKLALVPKTLCLINYPFKTLIFSVVNLSPGLFNYSSLSHLQIIKWILFLSLTKQKKVMTFNPSENHLSFLCLERFSFDREGVEKRACGTCHQPSGLANQGQILQVNRNSYRTWPNLTSPPASEASRGIY